ncbi:MAG: DMT family transporter, partial [Muribaculaceae bacterium]|nr:DMT family transporter [Muribaculaceae bacterium]
SWLVGAEMVIRDRMKKQSEQTGVRADVMRAHLALLLANIGWGVIAPVSKMVLLSGTITSLALSGIRISGAAFLFLIFTWVLPKSFETRQQVDKKDIFRLSLCSLLIISANQGLYIIGVGLTDPVDSAVMCSLTPVLTMVLAAMFLHFRMTWLKVGGVMMGLAGVLMLVSGTAESEIAVNPVLGNLLCLGAQLCAAIYYVGFEGLIRKYSPYSLMKWMFFISTLTYVPLCLPDMLRIDYSALPGEVWAGLAFIITIPTFFGYLMIPLAQRSLKPTVVSAYSYLQPVFAAIVAVIMSVGDFGWGKAIATLLIFVGIYFVNRSSTRHTA